ncbi:L-histidine N(alpha)-methyltransferase [Solimicrobium silvestre]|uniref:Dimethylhistidine N-methyltransferase n=1 Tax=Solimicrobium silvestre TaxID=2099400 RepID=A0A2S9GW72_9BURK|nr:L-histidine N(alpha)-methyltransferase [Solimicrobium silvestre]PRC91964.1 Dimethylhistidine N-methyltransferase [Solimicrobium silvestre]
MDLATSVNVAIADRDHALDTKEFTIQELTTGLLSDHATISPKYFYDTVGSVLFETICVLPEYYPTRTEAGIFTRHLTDISQTIGPGGTLIDLGAGNCAKAARLFPFLHPDQYVPIDISVNHLTDSVRHLRQRFPHIEMTALGMDFSKNWTLPDEVRSDQRLFFYPGSSIGNFHPDIALTFLKKIRAACDADGGILIGIDLIKDSATLNAAYDDDLGVTAAFNLNALRHVNQLLGSDFDIRQWQHYAFFNAQQSRIEMHLEARMNLQVKWGNNHRHFIRGERIHTENSYKYSLPLFLELLSAAGFGKARHWSDDANWYAVIYAKAI